MAKTKIAIQLNEEQKKAKSLILDHPYSFVTGHAGSGKTILACQIGFDKLKNKKDVDKIIITRPSVSTEENGFLPGTFQEKMEPWLIPIKSNFYKLHRTKRVIEKLYEGGDEEHKDVQMVSLTHFRGRTFENAVCIVDEFQNLTKNQLAMALGRLGKNSIMIFTGDPDQIDLQIHNNSAAKLLPALKESKSVNIVHLKENHRHKAVKEVLDLIKKHL